MEGYVKDLLQIKLTIYKEGIYAFQKNITSLPQSAKLTAPSSEGAKVDKKTDAFRIRFCYSIVLRVSSVSLSIVGTAFSLLKVKRKSPM